jgi:hypothetical protein
MASRIFGTAVGTAMVEKVSLRQRAVLDTIRGDVTRLRTALAPEERQKLDTYLERFEKFEERQRAAENIRCGQPTPGGTSPNEKLTSMIQMATLALQCGITNVVAVSMSTTITHDGIPKYQGIFAGGYSSHDKGVWPGQSHSIHQFQSGLMAGMIKALSPVGGIDPNTLFVYTGDTGLTPYNTHHGDENAFAALVISGMSSLKTGGRYIRYPMKAKNNGALWLTLSHGLGVPLAKHGNHDGPPLAELLP